MADINTFHPRQKKNIRLIAEIGQAHDGSLGLAHSYIDSLKNSGVTDIKFQVHIANSESSKKEKFRKKFSYEDKTRFDYWKRIEFSKEQWHGLFNHCKKNKIHFIASPFSIEAVNLLKKIGCKTFKIASGEVNNYLMIDRIINLKKEIILSSGLSNFRELDQVVNRIKKSEVNLSIMQCTTQYPSKVDNIGLNVINEMKKRYMIPAGLSDHSGNMNTLLAASALGAELIEFHVTFSKKSFGPDSMSSIEISKVKELVENINYIYKCTKNKINKSNIKINKNLKKIFSKSLAVNKDLKKNHSIKIQDLETKKPGGMGISSKDYKKIVGKKINKNLKKNSFLKLRDFG
tara:strand:+ start:420 stop:1457 length:1038 start_codon:yes stop_codon:yes gene_type:complete